VQSAEWKREAERRQAGSSRSEGRTEAEPDGIAERLLKRVRR